MEQNKKNKILIGIVLLIIVLILAFVGFKQYQIYMAEKQVETINNILEENLVSRDNCKPILDFDKTLISSDNKFFNEGNYDIFREKCDIKYNIANAELEEELCVEIIKSERSDLSDRFIILDEFSNFQNKCIDEFLKVEFSTGSFFDVEQDFKSEVNLDFSLDFFEDKDEGDSEIFLENRINAKKRLISLIEISPKVDLNIDNIVLYKKRAILSLDLKPETEYNISLKSFETATGKDTEKQIFNFTTPENKFFGFRIKEKVSLFADTSAPNFTFYAYNTEKTEAKIKICRINNEAYAKIEVYDEFPDRDFRRNFFKEGIDKIDTFECNTKVINLVENEYLRSDKLKNENIRNENIHSLQGGLIKYDFNFSEQIGELARSGLYYVTFENKIDREYNDIIQKPIFFGIIDSHITMKASANGEVFFFVNDFAGKPLANQEVRIYLNDFKSKKRKYNYNEDKDETIYYSPFEKDVLSKPIVLGKTGNDGILKINVKDKVDNFFSRTMDNWDYNYSGNLNSFFVTSASKTNLSYVSSTHNGGITPWNFGYSMGGWWYGGGSENADEIKLQKWGTEPKIYSHVFTDRKLYLPNEEVHIKSILRNSSDLSIPVGKEINLLVKDPQGKELVNKKLKVNKYGSINETLKLAEKSTLGNYNILLLVDDKTIGNSGFSVEIFKNPKFKNEIMLETEGLNGELVKITDTKITKQYYWEREEFSGDFKIKARVSSKYYNGASLKNSAFTYKVYKQYYYDNSYWDDCYYGCYWEPNKEFYTEGKGILDDNGISNFEIPVKFESSYSDYKYIVEVTVKDSIGDIISSSNSIIAKLPSEYKRWDPDSGITFNSEKRFYKSGEKIELLGSLNHGDFSKFYDDKFLLIIKSKQYETREVNDVRGYKRTITDSKELVEKIILVNSDNFEVTSEGKVKLDYITEKSGEYIFEFGKINKKYFLDSNEVIKQIQAELEETKIKKELVFSGKINKQVKVTYDNRSNLVKYCDGNKLECDRKAILKKLGCNESYIDKQCRDTDVNIEMSLKVKLDDLIDPDTRKYFTIISYGEGDTENPIINDNKLQILSEKISYNIGDKARLLIRLPHSEGKILLTIEKQGVMKSEYIDVKSNIFFKEFIIDDSFAPNSYISAVFIDTRKGIVPEYKVGYTEIVVDKTDKKAFIDISSDKKVYKPRETVTLDIEVKDKKNKPVESELTVMVVDDSLISLMGNVDLNTLEKIYKKVPFRIQTAITNIAMLQNYYFSRRGIVGGSGFGNFKGGDSVVSSRNIFRNTAYYNGSVITDKNGKAQVQFNLPDNLTNFRVMVVSNSEKNFFGSSQEFIEVRKNVIVEDKTPLILRDGDISKIGTQVFNNTSKKIGFKVELEAEGVNIKKKIQNIYIEGGESQTIFWEIIVPYNIEEIKYKISAIGDSKDNSDSIENTIKIKSSPILITNTIKNIVVPEGTDTNPGIGELDIEISDNIDISKSKVEVIFSNNKLSGIEKIVSSLLKYPYGCVEQTVSSTLPNAIILKFGNMFSGIISNEQEAKNNLVKGIERLKSMQLDNGAFSYWQGDTSEASLALNSYVLRSMLEMKEVYKDKLLNELIDKNIKYLESQILLENKNNISNSDKINIFYALSKAGKEMKIEINSDKLNRYDLIIYTYGLINSDKYIFKNEIVNNIEKIKKLLDNTNNDSYYSSSLNDKAIFANLLLDFGYDKTYTEKIVFELYHRNWSNYYYSTKTKANSFLVFAKYLEKYGVANKNRFGFSVGKTLNREKSFYVGAHHNYINKIEYNLSDVLDGEILDLKIANFSKGNLYVDVIIKEYPKDILKVKTYSNKVSIKREIYEVIDENKIGDCTNYWRYNYNTYSNEARLSCDNVLKLVTNNTYKKGGLYRVKITTNFDTSETRENFVIEDYLAGTFRIINSKFKTESALITQNTKSNNWSWNYTEYNPDVVMANDTHVWGDKKEFSYYVRAEFEGFYTQPPVTGYFMYNPLIRANSEFNIIEVK